MKNLQKMDWIEKMELVVMIIGPLVVGGIILYQTREDRDPMIVIGVVAMIITAALAVYIKFFLKKGD